MNGGCSHTQAPVNPLFDTIETVLQKVFYRQEITLAEQRAFDRACDRWEALSCRRTDCFYRGNSCRFFRADLDWVRFMGFADLCELLHAQTTPRSFDALRAEWARRSGHYNP